MALLASQVENILKSGCNVTIIDNNYLVSQVESMARIAKANGCVLTVNCTKYLASQIESIGRNGGKHVTVLV